MKIIRLLSATLMLIVALAPVPAAAGPTAASNANAPATYIVGFHDDVPVAPGDTLHGATVLSVNPAIGTAVARTDDATGFEADARSDDRVRYLSEDHVVLRPHLTPNDPRISEQWGWGNTPGIDAYGAWDTTLGSTAITVAVLDTGLDKNHEDIGNTLQGYDFADDDNDPSPAGGNCNGHGTHVAGTVGALTDNGVGVAGTAQTTILPVKVFTKAHGCGAAWSWVADGITYATDEGADVITMSLGCSTCDPNQAIEDAVQYAWDHGVLVIASAGNSGPCTDCVGYPASNPNVMAIAALEEDGTVASYSSSGPEVEISAPGSSILSTLPGDSYGSYSGTSMAAPHVAGTAALVLATGTMTNADLRDHLKATAVDLGYAASAQGAGATNACEAVGSTTCGSGSSGGDDTTNTAPTASFTVSCTDLTCTFDGTGSSDDDGTISSYDWDLGDGTTATGSTVEHTYASDGTYTVTLTVTDDDGATDSTSKDVTVSSSTDDGSGSASEMHVHDIDAWRNPSPHAYFDVWIYDGSEAPVSGATVTVEVCNSANTCVTGTGETGSDGLVSFKWKHGGSDTYTTCVTGLTHSSYTWNSTADHADAGSCETETI